MSSYRQFFMVDTAVMFIGEVSFIHAIIMSSPNSEIQPHPVPLLTTTNRSFAISFILKQCQVTIKICKVYQRATYKSSARTFLLWCPTHATLFATVAHVNTSDPPRHQPYWYHTRVVRLSVIGHSQWLPHVHGTLYRSTFRTRLLFPSSAEN